MKSKENYNPHPLDVTDITLPEDLMDLVELLSENVHDTWARVRFDAGWKWGEQRSDESRTNPCLVPYSDLPENEKSYDRATAIATLKAIIKFGFKISRMVSSKTCA